MKKQKRNLIGQFTRDLPVDRIKDGLRKSILERLRPAPVPARETDPWKLNPAKLVGALLLALAVPVFAGEQVVHERKVDGEAEAVVTLMDPDRSDPAEYRWVIVNARFHDYSLMVNRENGRVYQCLGKIRPWRGDDPGKQCVRVYDGPVVSGGK